MRATKLRATVWGAAVLVTCCASLTTAGAEPPPLSEEEIWEPAVPPEGSEPPSSEEETGEPDEAEPLPPDAWQRAISEMLRQGRSFRPRRMPTATCLAQGGRGSGGPDPCRVGAMISRMRPCLDAEDCPAYELWVELYGAPRVGNAAPESAPSPGVGSDSEDRESP